MFEWGSNLAKEITIEKVIHQVWKEWQSIDKSNYEIKESIIGKYQYIISNEKGQQISLIELPNYFHDGVTLWEIYCLNNNLFDDVERFGTFEGALEAAKKYLNEEKS